MPKTVSLLYSALLSTFIFQVNAVQMAELDSFDLDALSPADEIPVVLTAARLRQSQLDTPASVTVIESETIAALGFKDIEEIFRLVPGMLVGYHSGVGEKAPSVSYHGTLLPEHRRLQVLIDGRSVFKPGLARVEWVDIPLAIEDIDRIEVIRGPNSAAYGANSYLGVINIMTKHPQLDSGKTLKITSGTRDTLNSYLKLTQSTDNLDFRLTLGSKQKSGFDELTNGERHRDGLAGAFINARSYYHFNAENHLDVQFGYKDGVKRQRPLNEDVIIYNDPEDIQAEDYFISFKYSSDYSSKQSGQLQLYSQHFVRTTEWNACFQLAPSSCGDLNKNIREIKSELEYQHTSIWNADFRTVAGMRFRLDEFDSQTYNSGYSSNENISAFINMEYKPSKRFTFNVGGLSEDDELNGASFSPRLAINTHLTDSDTLRFIYSEAIRSPDLYEQQGLLTFTFENFQVGGVDQPNFLFPVGNSTGTLKNEKIYSHEISYFSLLPKINSQLDLKLFFDKLNGLISESLEHDPVLTNSRRLEMRGVEGQLKWHPSNMNQLLLSFSFMDTEDDFPTNYEAGEISSETQREQSLSADFSGSVSWIHRPNIDSTYAASYYHVDNWNPYADGGYLFSRLDLAYTNQVGIAEKQNLQFKLNLQYRFDDDPLNRTKNNYSDDYLLYGSIAYKF